VVAVGVGIFAALSATRPTASKVTEADEVRRVVAIDVLDEPVGRRFRAYGTARALDSADVPARVEATISELGPAYRPGHPIAKGELLLTLDPSDFRRQLSMATDSLAALDAQLAMLAVDERTATEVVRLAEEDHRLALADVERARSAQQDDAALSREVDRLRQAAIVAERSLLIARETLAKLPARRLSLEAERARQASVQELAELSLERCRIESPLDGVVQVADKEVGEIARMGVRVARVVGTAQVEIPLLLPASARGSVRVGDAVFLNERRSTGDAIVGTVSRIAPEDDPETRTFAVYVETTAAGGVTPGAFVEASVAAAGDEPRSVLPRRSVSGGRIIDLTDGRAATRGVEVEFGFTALRPETGLPDSEWVVLRERLPPGTRVALDGSRQIIDGTAVRPTPPGADGGGAPAPPPSEVLGHRGAERPGRSP
jgi:multidrug resistance efflux pump